MDYSLVVTAHFVNYRKLWIPKIVDGVNIRDCIEPYFQLTDDYGQKYFVLEEYRNKIYCSTRLCGYLVYVCSRCNFVLDFSEVQEKFGSPQFDIDGTDLSFLYENKFEWVRKITKRSSGLIQLPTGTGKTEIMGAIIKSWRDSGNILIMAPRNSVCEEIRTRLLKYNIITPETDDYYIDCRGNKVYIINPTGFCRSYKFQDNEILEDLRNVNLILIDECESITSSIETLIEQHCINDKYIYGFSASADKYEGRELLSTEVFSTLNYDTYCVMYYVGDSSVFKEPTEPIHLKIIQCKSNSYFGTGVMTDSRYSIEAMLYSFGFQNFLLDYIAGQISDLQTLYIPCMIGEHVDSLFNKLKLKGRTVHWTALGIYDSKTEDYIDQDELTKLVETHDVKFVISTQTSWYGVSMKFTDILLFIGSKYNIIIQTIGRVLRVKGPNIWIPSCSTENNMFRRASFNRQQWVRSVYPLLSEEHILIDSRGLITRW